MIYYAGLTFHVRFLRPDDEIAKEIEGKNHMHTITNSFYKPRMHFNFKDNFSLILPWAAEDP